MARGKLTKAPDPPPAPAGARTARAPLIVLLSASVLLSLAAALALLLLFAELPANQYARMDLRALAAARERYRGPAAEASVLIATSLQISQAARDPNFVAEALDEARGRLRLLKSTGLGHVQYLTLVMIQSDLAGEPVAERWGRIRDAYAGLSSRPLEHYLPAFMDAERGAWMEARLSARAAAARARSMSAAHGVFLQCFTHASQAIIDALRASGDPDGAAACERVLLHVLRALVLSEGPPELRVPVAALLVETLGARDFQSGVERAAAAACTEWRAGIRQLAMATACRPYALHGAEPAMLDAPDDPGMIALVPFWTAAAGAGAAAVAVTSLTLRAMRRRRVTISRADALLSPILALAICVAALVTVRHAPSLANDDLTRLSSDNAGVPRGPMIWAAAGAGVAIAASLVARQSLRGTAPAVSAAGLAVCAWPALLLCALLLYPYARAAVEREPPSTAAPLRATGDKLEQQLRVALHEWTP